MRSFEPQRDDAKPQCIKTEPLHLPTRSSCVLGDTAREAKSLVESMTEATRRSAISVFRMSHADRRRDRPTRSV
jgi:hypothetical protein